MRIYIPSLTDSSSVMGGIFCWFENPVRANFNTTPFRKDESHDFKRNC